MEAYSLATCQSSCRSASWAAIASGLDRVVAVFESKVAAAGEGLPESPGVETWRLNLVAAEAMSVDLVDAEVDDFVGAETAVD